MGTEKNFFKQLFDLSFENFITVKIIKFLYVLAIFVWGLIGLIILIRGLIITQYSVDIGFLMVVLAPLVTLLGIIWSRVSFELTVIFFNIEKNTAKICEIIEKQQNTER